MTSLIDLDNIKIKEKGVFCDWEYLICENDGSYSEEDQYVILDNNGVEVIVYFTLSIKGWWTYVPETYLQPAEGEVHITDVDFDVDTVIIDEDEIKVSNDLRKMLENFLKNNICDE